MVILKFILQVPLITLALFGVESLLGISGWQTFLVAFLALIAFTTGDFLDRKD